MSRLVLVLLLVTAFPAAAQELDPEPPMPEAPVQFRVGAMATLLDWAGPGAGGSAVEDVLNVGLDLETLLFRYGSIRLGTSFGQPRIRSSQAGVDVDQYTVELSAVGRLATGPWTRVGLVPFGAVGVGTVVHAPESDDLISKNQNSLSWGGGLEWTDFHGLGARVEWRDMRVELGDVFDPEARSSENRDVQRITGVIFWTF